MLGPPVFHVVGQQCCVRLHGPLGINHTTFKVTLLIYLVNVLTSVG